MNDNDATAGAQGLRRPAAGGRGRRGPARPGSANQPIEMGMLPDLIGFNLRCAQIALFQHFNAAMGDAAISAPQFGTLLLIEQNPGVSQSAVAEALRFDRSTLVQIIDRLESRELVVREISAHDRRSHALRLTEDGAALLARLKKAALVHEQEIARGLDNDEKNVLIGLLRRIHSPER